MSNEDSWQDVRIRRPATHSSYRTGALNMALLFGMATVALTLVLTPILASKQDNRSLAMVEDDLDKISTASIPEKSGERGKTYSIRRSILQETPGSVCIVEGYGSGGCQ